MWMGFLACFPFQKMSRDMIHRFLRLQVDVHWLLKGHQSSQQNQYWAMRFRIFCYLDGRQWPKDIFWRVHQHPKYHICYPVQSSQLNSLSMTCRLSPSSEHRTSSLCQFSNHMNSPEVLKFNTTTISDSSHFLIVFFVSIRKSNFIVEIKDSSKGKIRGSTFQEFRQFLRKSILNLSFNVVPQLVQKEVKFLFKQDSMSQTHLIHIAISMQKFHSSGSSSNLIKLSVLMFLQQLGLVIPDRLVIDIVLPWFSMTVGCLCNRCQAKSK